MNTRCPGIHSLVLALTWAMPAFAAEPEVHAMIEQGNERFVQGDYPAAISHYQRARNVAPELAIIHYNLANTYFREHKHDQAREAYALAIRGAHGRLLARARFNLGNLMYRAGVDAMLTFQDAVTPLRAAIDQYRQCLSLDLPERAAARYNLELATRLLAELEQQKVQAQPNPEMRNQQTSQNQGQAFEQRLNQETAGRDLSLEQMRDREPSGAQRAPEGDSPMTESATQTDEARGEPELSPEQAEQMLELIRERSRASAVRRREARRARLGEAAVERVW